MSPHDQQLEVASPPPSAKIVLEASIAIEFDVLQLVWSGRPRPRPAHAARRLSGGFNRWTGEARPERGGPCRSRLARARAPAPHRSHTTLRTTSRTRTTLTRSGS